MTTLIPKYDQGSTNAVNRPFNQKLQETISVKDFGAKGDGTTDDTTSIQNAINYAAPLGKTVFIPAGVYSITALTLPQQNGGIDIVGEARCDSASLSTGAYKGSVLISTQATGNIISADGGSGSNNKGIRISNLALKVSTSGYAISIVNSAEQTTLADLTILNINATGGNGINLDTCFVGCLISNCLVQGVYNQPINGTFGVKVSSSVIAGGYLFENSTFDFWGTGLDIGGNIYQMTVLNVGMEVCYLGTNIHNGANVQLNNCHYEGNKINGIYVASSFVVQINECSFYADGTVPTTGFVNAGIYIVGESAINSNNVVVENCFFFGVPSNSNAIYVENSQYSSGIIRNNNIDNISTATSTTGIAVAGTNPENWEVTTNFIYGGITTPYSPLFGFKSFSPSVGGIFGMVFNSTQTTASNANNNSLFVNAATGKLSYKDSSGVVNALY
jgi:polygalacturonase